ncbi:hypothetical protein Y032_0012g1861 [Ancylostoma ceylanicum]|uniref:Uncharacterized protein n=1 Tax=Ancylostoma ceylanicum TaxID=53326 RepID=A0A016VDP4_9BILA|nr:hypothetical protein Y032_0012g1861 [Ancylostoma ceylanicum]
MDLQSHKQRQYKSRGKRCAGSFSCLHFARIQAAMGDKSCYMGAGGYSGYMGSGTQGQGYAREEYAGNVGGGGGGGGGGYAYSSGGGGYSSGGGGYSSGGGYGGGQQQDCEF